MNISVILAHPYKESLNHAIAQTVLWRLKENGHKVKFHDLYDEQFDPVVTGYELVNNLSEDELVERHCEEIRKAEGIVIIHPNWWGQPPAILKGWVDRVLRPGTAYGLVPNELGKIVPTGILIAQQVVVFNTSNTPDEREIQVLGDPLDSLWRKCTFQFCGVDHFFKKIFCVVEDSDENIRLEWLKETNNIIEQYFPQKK